MIERGESPIGRPTWRLIRRRGVMAVWACIVLAATTAMAQQSLGTVTETVTLRRDLNGRNAVTEKVVTHRARTKGEERVVVETYLPSIEAGRLMLSQRVTRVTTVMSYGTQIVEQIERTQSRRAERATANRSAIGDDSSQQRCRVVRDRAAGLRT